MCDYCDCRSVALIDRLGAEHGRLLELSSEVRTKALVGDVTAARRALAELVSLLDTHTRVEEGALFPLLRDEGMAVTADCLQDDHRTVDRLQAEAGGASDAEWPSIAIELLAVLAEHIREEEYDVFPAAVQLVPPGRWDHAHATVAQLTG